MGNRIIEILKPNTTYLFKVRAKNIVGSWGALSTVVQFTTPADTETPAVLSSITLLMLDGIFQLKWAKPSTLDLRSGGYKIYVFTADTPASAKLIREVGYTSNGVEILIGEQTLDAAITITAGVSYWFWVTTLDATGNESAKVATTPGSGSVTAGATTSYVDSADTSLSTVTSSNKSIANSQDTSQSTLVSVADSKAVSAETEAQSKDVSQSTNISSVDSEHDSKNLSQSTNVSTADSKAVSAGGGGGASISYVDSADTSVITLENSKDTSQSILISAETSKDISQSSLISAETSKNLSQSSNVSVADSKGESGVTKSDSADTSQSTNISTGDSILTSKDVSQSILVSTADSKALSVSGNDSSTNSEADSKDTSQSTLISTADSKAVSAASAGTPGEGHITILPYSYSAITQGTWVIYTAATQILYSAYYNSTHAQNDQIDYKVYLAAGTYTFMIAGIRDNNRAILTLLFDGVSQGTTDLYNLTSESNYFGSITGIVVSTSGLKTVSMKAATKNASSSDYYLVITYMVLYRTA